MKAFEATDVFKHRTLAELNGSTQHDQLVFKVTRAREQEDNYETRAWRLTNDADAPRPMTSTEFSIGTPRWNSDGTLLAFISQRGDGGSQVHVMPCDGGEARRLSNMKARVSTLHGWLPDDTALLVSAACDWNEDHDPDAPKGKRSPAVVCYLPYKSDGSGIQVGERTHLYRIEATTGAATRLTKGDFDVASGKWSDDGLRLAFVRDRAERERCHADLWIADADGGNARRRVSTVSSIASVSWSPDNRRILFSGSVEPGDSQSRLWCVEVQGDAAPMQLGGADFELEPGTQIAWHPDGDRVAVVCIDKGLMRLAVVTVPGGAVQVFDRGLRAVNMCTAWGQRLAFISTSMRRLEEVHSIRWDGTDEHRHSRFNRWFGKRPRPRVVRRRFAVPNGDGGRESIRAWVLTPSKGKGPFPCWSTCMAGRIATCSSISTSTRTGICSCREAGRSPRPTPSGPPDTAPPSRAGCVAAGANSICRNTKPSFANCSQKGCATTASLAPENPMAASCPRGPSATATCSAPRSCARRSRTSNRISAPATPAITSPLG